MRAKEFIIETGQILVNGQARPTTNSNGQPIHSTEQGIQKFWQWFGDSKVVDEQGRPLVVHHATQNNFSKFDIGRSSPSSRFGPGFYFTADQKTIDSYKGKTGTVHSVYLRIINPKTDDAMTSAQVAAFFDALQVKVFQNGFDATAIHESAREELMADPSSAFSRLLSLQVGYIAASDWVRGMKAAGFDGIIREVFGSPEYVVISPNQIKTITNRGSFSDDDEDINEDDAQQDLFPDEFANKKTKITQQRTLSSKGPEPVLLRNTNSAGRQIAPTKQALDKFWNWYHNGPQDAKGRPMLLFHSTNADVGAFKSGIKTHNNYGFLGNVEVSRAGIFATSDKKLSQHYFRGDSGGENVMPIYMALQNPLDLRNGLSEGDEYALSSVGVSTRYLHNISDWWELFDNDDNGGNAFVDALRQAGYDGAIFYEGVDGKSMETYVALNPNQIKSAIGNRGTYNQQSNNVAENLSRRKPRPPSFKEWHGYSRAKGIFYHKTNSDFHSFSPDKRELGFHFGTLSQAEGMSRLKAMPENTHVMPVYLSIQYPIRLKDTGSFYADAIAPQLVRKKLITKQLALQIKEESREWAKRKKWTDYVRKVLQDAGYDGVVYKNEFEGPKTGDSWIAFEPNQIKSAVGNRGTYDTRSDNITETDR